MEVPRPSAGFLGGAWRLSASSTPLFTEARCHFLEWLSERRVVGSSFASSSPFDPQKVPTGRNVHTEVPKLTSQCRKYNTHTHTCVLKMAYLLEDEEIGEGSGNV